MTNEEVLAREFELLRLDVIAEYEAKGMRASGDFANSLVVETERLKATLRGNSYAEQLEAGREPTGAGTPGDKPLLEHIKDWIADKGIKPIEKEMSVSTLAFLITRKIHREGWNRAKHGGTELISTVITPERVQRIIDRVTQFNIAKFTSEIKQMYLELTPA